jgi:hypothetical protein
MAGKPHQFCKVCAHPKAEAINRAIANCEPPNAIGQRLGGFDQRTIYKHSRRCLELSVLDALRERRVKQAVSVYDELAEQLHRAKETREAARKWLDVDGELNLDYRPTEVMVVYEDHDDLTERGTPRRKKATLQSLMDTVTENSFGSIRAVSGYAKRTDLRELLLKAIDRCDMVIDKFAKIQGDYQSDRVNDTDIDRIKAQIQSAATRFQTDFLTELEYFMQTRGHKLRPDIQENLRIRLLDAGSGAPILLGGGE